MARSELPSLREVRMERVRLKPLSRDRPRKARRERMRQGRRGVGVELPGDRGPVHGPVDRLPEFRVAPEEAPVVVEEQRVSARRRLDPEAAGADRLATADTVLLRHVDNVLRREAPEVEL